MHIKQWLKMQHKSANNNGQLNDDEMLNALQQFSEKLDIMEKDLNNALMANDVKSLNINEKIQLDMYFAYVNSTLFWMYLKLQGADVSKHYILHDLGRAKEMLARDKELHDLKYAPRLNMSAIKRFIAAGVHTRFIEVNGVTVADENCMQRLIK